MESVGIPFELLFCSENEPKPYPSEDARQFALRAAFAKAKSGLNKLADTYTNDFLIIAADTLVSFGGEILGKPDSKDDAFQILKKLSGKKHQVITACQLLWRRDSSIHKEAFAVSSDVFLILGQIAS